MFETISTSVLCLLAIIIVIYFGIKRDSRLKKNLEQQALKRNGVVKKGKFFTYSRLIFSQNGNEITVYSIPGGKNSPPHTYITCDLSSLRDYKIKICREYRIFGIGTVFGQDIKLNNPNFDENYVIQGSDEMIVRQFLTQDIQENILKFKENKPILEIKKNKFKFYVPYIPKDEQQYDQLIDTGLILIKRARKMS